MADVDLIDENGLQLKTFDVILDELKEKMKAIYGDDINVETNSPDGQMLNIFAQAGTDIREVVQRIYDILDLDNATGINLDRACALIGIWRKAGTRTITPITITTTEACTLTGYAQDPTNAYTVQDNAANRWQLVNTYAFAGADAISLSFQSEIIGKQETTPNTITTPVTLVLGVASVNNPTIATIVGEDEETDFELRTRAKRSIMLASVGFTDSLYAALMSLDGMDSARILENYTSVVDANGTSPHSIHVITSGSASNEDIANTIMQKRSAGCGMDGEITYSVMNADGYPIDIKWSVVTPRFLFAYASVASLDGVNLPNYNLIKSELPNTFTPALGKNISVNQLVEAVAVIDPNTYVDDACFTFGQKQKFNYVNPIDGTRPNNVTMTVNKIKIKYNGNESAEIDLTDTTENITAIIHAVAGLSDVTFTNDTATTGFTIEFASIDDVLGLIEISQQQIYYSSGGTTTYYVLESTPQDSFKKTSPISYQYQLTLASDRIVLSPLVINNDVTEIKLNDEVTFTATGGTGTYYWYAIDGNGDYYDGFPLDTDGNLDTTGVFTASAVEAAVTIYCADTVGNFVSKTIAVVS